MNKFKKLKEENEKIREQIDALISLEHPLYSPIWNKINLLIENEIEQEGMCNE
jgi:hypothetical protein